MASIWIETRTTAKKLHGNLTMTGAMVAFHSELKSYQEAGFTARCQEGGYALLYKKGHGLRLLYLEPYSPPTRDLETGQPRMVEGRGYLHTHGATQRFWTPRKK